MVTAERGAGMPDSEHDNPPVRGRDAGRGHRNVYLLLLLPWPLLAFGFWSLYHVRGPAAEGFGAGGYASALLATCYGLALYLFNRAVVQTRAVAGVGAAGRFPRIMALLMFCIGVLGVVPMLFFIYLGLPFSLAGVVLIVMALFSWRQAA